MVSDLHIIKGEIVMKYIIILILAALIIFVYIKCMSSKSRQNHFNELASEPESQPDRILDTLEIQKGWSIGDLGAGGGYFTYMFAEVTGIDGKVFAADIKQDFLENIEKTAKEKGLQNITTILSTEEDSNFENNSLDLIFIRNTFHHFENKGQYLKNLIPKLKYDGRIAIIDYKEDASFWLFHHNVSKKEILSAIEESGLVIENEYDFLDKQYFFILKYQ